MVLTSNQYPIERSVNYALIMDYQSVKNFHIAPTKLPHVPVLHLRGTFNFSNKKILIAMLVML